MSEQPCHLISSLGGSGGISLRPKVLWDHVWGKRPFLLLHLRFAGVAERDLAGADPSTSPVWSSTTLVITSWSDKTRKFTSAPMSSTESTLWLREVLEEIGFKPEDTARVSSHSLKSTLLSWAAKSGKFSDPQRRQMGHHYDPQDKSMLVYSRDSYAPIAVAVRLMLDDITAGRFNPDLPRIERIAKAVEMAEEKGGSSSSDSSSSDEIAANSPSTKLANPNSITLDRHSDLPNVPSSFVMVHRLSGVLHVSAADDVFACGRRITSSFVEWSSDRFETVDTDVCTQCKAKAPLHFMEEASDQYEPSIGGLSDL